MAIQGQLAHSEGLIGYALNAQVLSKTFWTVSAWTDEAALNRFVRTQPHLGVMQRLRGHMGPTRFRRWTLPGSALPPAWPTVITQVQEGP
jgi:hypothetical protein